jgi:hypothetical protein
VCSWVTSRREPLTGARGRPVRGGGRCAGAAGARGRSVRASGQQDRRTPPVPPHTLRYRGTHCPPCGRRYRDVCGDAVGAVRAAGPLGGSTPGRGGSADGGGGDAFPVLGGGARGAGEALVQEVRMVTRSSAP